jgi:2-C-methyl-D-erythritol 4-phosphate cytidylyltransferase
MKKIAIVTAGGMGTRMGAKLPKQFLLLSGKPVLWHTLNAFINAFEDIDFVLVVPDDFVNTATELASELNISQKTVIVVGGPTRFDSVKNGLATIKESAIVFVHDGVRCLVSPDLIKRCYVQAIEKGSAIPAVASTDSVRIAMEDDHKVIDRAKVSIIQTPQTFKSELILPAFNQSYQERFTDEATVVESTGNRVYLIEGDYQNIKITRPIDLIIAEQIIADRVS